MNIGSTPVEQTTTFDERLAFIDEQDVAAGEPKKPAYTIDGPEGYTLFVDEGTPFAPEFRDATGKKLDPSTRITVQKCDKQGNLLGGGVVFSELVGRFNYDRMRNDPDFFRRFERSLMVDEREIVKVLVDIPAGSPGFSAAQSRMTIGDDTSDFGTPAEIVDHDDLGQAEMQAIKAASQVGN